MFVITLKDIIGVIVILLALPIIICLTNALNRIDKK